MFFTSQERYDEVEIGVKSSVCESDVIINLASSSLFLQCMPPRVRHMPCSQDPHMLLRVISACTEVKKICHFLVVS